jgi:small subunit ribosomal protein S20
VPNIKSQKKRDRQNIIRRAKNVQVKSAIKTLKKKLVKLIEKEDTNIDEINDLYKKYVKTVDTAAGKKVIKRTTSARYKSRLANKINSLAS